MDKKMFCFQCEQTAGCTGCTGNTGVCGKRQIEEKRLDAASYKAASNPSSLILFFLFTLLKHLPIVFVICLQ